MDPIEILATIFAVFILVKVGFLLSKPKDLKGLSKSIMKQYRTAMGICIALAAIVGYFVFTSIPAAEVAAVMLFTSLITRIGLFSFPKALSKFSDELIKTRILTKSWFTVVVLVAISIWVLYSIYA